MEPADLGHHISRRFNEDLEKLRSRVLQMGGFVEQQLERAVTALVEGDSRLGEQVVVVLGASVCQGGWDPAGMCGQGSRELFAAFRGALRRR
jgi:hypothetical protein